MKADSKTAAELARQVLVDSVPGLSIRDAESGPNLGRADITAMVGKRKYIIEIKFRSTVRVEEFIGAMSAGALNTTRIARTIGATPVVLGAARRIGTGTVKKVEQFMLANAPDVEWGLIDFAGRVRLHLPSQGLDIDEAPPRSPSRGESIRRHNIRLFSDLNRWMLKVLLLKEAPDRRWGGPRKAVGSPTQLGAIAGVSTAKAHRFYRTFEDLDYLRRGEDGLQVVRKRSLIQAWLAEESLQYRREMPVRYLYGQPSNVLDDIKEKRGLPFAVAGFEACRLHDVLHTTYHHLSLHVRDEFTVYLDSWELEECPLRDAHFVLVRPRYPESVFRGVVEREGLPVVDILQAALDVRPQKPRGAEQAEFIIDHVLKWDDSE